MDDEPSHTIHPAWRIDEPHPTDLIVHWPHESAPTQFEIRALFSAATDREIDIIEELDSPDPQIIWNAVMEVEPDRPPAILWCEPSKPLPPDEDAELGLASCPWVIGCQTMLDRADPITTYASIMRLLARVFDEAPAILDVTSGHWFTRRDLQEIFVTAAHDPPEEVLWMIHAVSAEGGGDEAPTWLHTHGLNRCGRPELEMLEVPRAMSGAAGELINNIAEFFLENPMPPPGEPVEIGPGLRITFQPWREGARYLAPNVPGALADRKSKDMAPAHTGVRATICAPEPRGVFRKAWVWPREVIERLANDDAIIYRTERATARIAALARATWPEFAMAFASLASAGLAPERDDADTDFLIKAGFSQDGGNDGDDDQAREHLWFRVLGFEGNRAQGRLVNTPIHIRRLKEGDRVWIDRDQISDWSVSTPIGRYEPGRRAGLDEAIEKIRDGA